MSGKREGGNHRSSDCRARRPVKKGAMAVAPSAPMRFPLYRAAARGGVSPWTGGRGSCVLFRGRDVGMAVQDQASLQTDLNDIELSLMLVA